MLSDLQIELYAPDDAEIGRWGLTREEVLAVYNSGQEGYDIPRLNARFRWIGPRNAAVAAAIHLSPADDLARLEAVTVKAEAARVTLPPAPEGKAEEDKEAAVCLDIIPTVPENIRTRLEPILDANRFDFDNPPPELPPVITLDAGGRSHVIACTGYLVAIQGGPKAGKSAVLQAIMAASMTPPSRCIDAFGFKAWNEAGKAVVHFDFEQSARDHDRLMRCALQRAGAVREPSWMRSYRLTKLDAQSRMFAFLAELDRAQREHGGIFAVILDGLADLIPDPNDPEKAFQLVDMLHALAEKLETVIVSVIHENPGTETGKTRGHLGSHLERKAETNLRLSKEGATTTIFSEKSRSCNIPKEIGPRFAYDESLGLHVSTATLREAKDSAKREELAELARAVFNTAGESILPYGRLRDEVKRLNACGHATAERVIKKMKDANIVACEAGLYRITI
jgi:hypothetical protein